MQQQPQEPLALFDAHAHYDDARFAQELPQGPQALLQELFDKNTVCGVCNSASDLASARAAQALAAQYEKVVFTAGIHPHQAQQATKQTEQKVLSELGELLADPKWRLAKSGWIITMIFLPSRSSNAGLCCKWSWLHKRVSLL